MTIHPYGPTAARKHGKPGRALRPKTTTIDIHSHVGVPAAAAIVKDHLDPATVPLAHFSTPKTKQVNQRQEADRRAFASAVGPQEAGPGTCFDQP